MHRRKFHVQGIVLWFAPQQNNNVCPCSAHYSLLESRSISLISNSTATMILQVLKFHVPTIDLHLSKTHSIHLVLPCPKSLKIGCCACDRLFFSLQSIDLSDFQVVRGWSMSKRSWTSVRLFSSLKSHTLQTYTFRVETTTANPPTEGHSTRKEKKSFTRPLSSAMFNGQRSLWAGKQWELLIGPRATCDSCDAGTHTQWLTEHMFCVGSLSSRSMYVFMNLRSFFGQFRSPMR